MGREDFGTATRHSGEFRPTPGWMAMGLRNRFASGDMMLVETVSVPMIDRLQKNLPLVGCSVFRDGNKWSVFVLNRKLGGVCRGVEQGSGNIPFKKTGRISRHKLTGTPRDGNRESMNLEIQSAEIPDTALAAADGTLRVDAASGATPEGLPAGSIFLYVFKDAAQ
jgi:hypothetical protein